MTREYDEKRDFIRLDVDCEIVFKATDSSEPETGRISNLSGRGMMFIADRELIKDSVVEVNIKPANILTPPLHANVKLVRVIKQRHANGYEIGAVIQDIYDDNE
jgi:hypothetical protein